MSEHNRSSEEKLSICAVIPAFNAEKFIGETLAAVAGQRRPPDEVIVIDDGSEDDTVSTVESLVCEVEVPLQILKQSNKGPSAARNAGVLAASTDMIATIDADDVVLPNHLEVLEAGFRQRPELDLCFADAESFSGSEIVRASFLRDALITRLPCHTTETGLRIIKGSAYRGIVAGNPIPTSATLYRRQTALDVGLYNPSFPRCNDREFLLRMSRRCVFGYFPVVVERIRRHEANLTHVRHHPEHLKQQIRVGEAMLEAAQVLRLNPSEIDATRMALAEAAGTLCYYKARSGLREYLTYLATSVLRASRPSSTVVARNLLRSIHCSLRATLNPSHDL